MQRLAASESSSEPRKSLRAEVLQDFRDGSGPCSPVLERKVRRDAAAFEEITHSLRGFVGELLSRLLGLGVGGAAADREARAREHQRAQISSRHSLRHPDIIHARWRGAQGVELATGPVKRAICVCSGAATQMS